MQWLFVFFIVGSFFFALITGEMDALSTAVLSCCNDGVTLTLSLLGSMAFWNGILQIAKDSGLSKKICLYLQKPIQLIFRGINDPQILQNISMNITANLLGLGNAATPIGLRVMKQLDAQNQYAVSPSADMIRFVVLNTASLQLIPTTVAVLRQEAGSSDPFSILPACLLTSLCTLIIALLAVSIGVPSERKSS